MEREKISWSHHKALPGLERCCAGLDVGRARAGAGAGSSRELGGDLAPSGSARAPRPERGAGAGVAGSRGRPLGTGSAVRWGRAGEAQSAAGRRVFLYLSFQERVVKVWSEWVMAHGSGRMARDFFYQGCK